jgi:hypothetical protein
MTDYVITEPSTLDISTATVRITSTVVRPSTSTPRRDKTVFNTHMIDTYNAVGKRWQQTTYVDGIDSEQYITSGLTATYVTYWLNWIDWQDSGFNDPIVMQNDFVDAPAYNQTNNMSVTSIKEFKINETWHALPATSSDNLAIKLLRLQELKGS